MARGEFVLPWRVVESNLPEALTQPSIAVTDLAGKEWVFGIYKKITNHHNAIKLQEDRSAEDSFMADQLLKRGDVVALSRAPAQVGGSRRSASVPLEGMLSRALKTIPQTHSNL